jgi:hypothetical protein
VNLNDAGYSKKINLKEILGLGGEGIIWGRLAMFVAASILSNLVYIVQQALSRSPLPAELRLWFYGVNVAGPLLLAAAIWVGFRFVRNEWAAIAGASFIYMVLIFGLRILLNPLFKLDFHFVYSWLWVFLTLAGISIALRVSRSILLALIVGNVTAMWLNQAIVILIGALTRPEIQMNLKDELLYAGLNLVSSAIFGIVFWAGLHLEWCRPETLGTSTTAGADGTMAAAWDDIWLKTASDFRALRVHLRSAGVGSILFGLLAICLGVLNLSASPVNIVLMLLGVLLIGEGGWVLAAPSPAGVIADGFVLIAVGAWNLVVSLINLANSSSSHIGPFVVFGAWQIGWGIQGIRHYKRYAHLKGVSFSEEASRKLNERIGVIWRVDPASNPDRIEFRTKTVFRESIWRGQMLPEWLLLSPSGKTLLVVPKKETEMVIPGEDRSQDSQKARILLEKQTFWITISRESWERFRRWKQ